MDSNDQEIINEIMGGFSPLMKATLKNATGFMGLINGIKNNPKLSEEQRKVINDKLKENGFDNLDAQMKDALDKLKNVTKR